MSRFLIAWEMGVGLSYMRSLQRLALALRDRGHEVHFALRDLSRAEATLGVHGFPLMQAPLWQPRRRGLPPAANHAEVLSRLGYLDESGLLGVAKAWCRLLEMVRPDVLLAEHAPTALLSAAALGVPRAMIGSGFTCPPPVTPLPALLPDANIPPSRFEESERRVLLVMNAVLGALGATTTWSTSAELFRVQRQFLCTFPELDPFRGYRDGLHYWGPRGLHASSNEPQWPGDRGPRIFAYIHPGSVRFESLVKHLAQSPYATLIHAPGLSPQAIEGLRSPTTYISTEPVNLPAVCEQCDTAVCHAGHAAIAAALLAGRPLLLVPFQVEQLLNARQVSRLGAALMVGPNIDQPDYAGLLDRLLGDTHYRTEAQVFAQQHAGFDEIASANTIAQELEGLVRGAGRAAP